MQIPMNNIHTMMIMNDNVQILVVMAIVIVNLVLRRGR